ncbi:hypothetical protein GCM10007416_35790 [Kroppenstedtia guangzhouensis]|uniref:Uncharacterized protein n=1 Tax=Kroppenstedtia guangzhouensis TaxID=1274356 RepID=A0ABQ1H7A8_9BACL|nr:hypothetical protein [Kroppenstedtia guangzhouensis]GGA59661.1 hypothetical protein GCM10007416_35790 [Kroppenstedtia guangzhouensis]
MDVIERINAQKKERMEELKRNFPEVMKHLVLNGLEVSRALILGELKIFKEGVEIRCPSRGRMKNTATAYVAAKNLSRCVLLVRGCGGRRAGIIEGPAVKWSYSDGHGGTLWAVLERGKSFNMSIPPGFHGPMKKSRGYVHPDGRIEWEEEPSDGVREVTF